MRRRVALVFRVAAFAAACGSPGGPSIDRPDADDLVESTDVPVVLPMPFPLKALA